MADNPPVDAVPTGGVPPESGAFQSAMEIAVHDEIMKQIFGDVGELQNDFSCAIESTVLLHGRMYITDKFICFYSNLFGMEKKIRIPYSHITLITKEKTALVIPNAIAITTYRKEYVFRSFWDRDECFEMLKAFIKKFKGVPSQPNGSSTVPPTLRDSVAAPSAPNGSPDASKPKTNNAPDNEDGSKSAKRRSLMHGGPLDIEEDSLIGNIVDPDAAVNPNMQVAFDEDVNNSKLKLTIYTGERIPISLRSFIEKFVDDSATYSLQRHHEVIGDQNMALVKWTVPLLTNEPGNSSALVTATRDMKFMKIVNLPGLKQTRGIKIQKCQRFGELGIILQTSTRLDDVPMADSFSVEEVIVVRPVGEGDNQSVVLDVYLEVKFVKYTILKSLIESNTHSEVTKWLQEYVAALKNAVLTPPTSPVEPSADSSGPYLVTPVDAAKLIEESRLWTLKVVCFQDEVIDMSLKDFHAAFVVDAASYSLSMHHTLCKDSDMVLQSWDKDQTARTMAFMKLCNLPGLKQTRALKSQKWIHCGAAGSIFYTSTKLDDVPMADCFTVDDCFIVKSIGPDKISVDATMEVKFVKYTMMKSFIELSTNKEVIAWCKEYIAELKKRGNVTRGSSGGVSVAGVASATAGATAASSEPSMAIVPVSGGPFNITTWLLKVDEFFESIGFTGGRYICAMFALLFISLIFFAISWQSVSYEVHHLRNEVQDLSRLLKQMLHNESHHHCHIDL